MQDLPETSETNAANYDFQLDNCLDMSIYPSTLKSSYSPQHSAHFFNQLMQPEVPRLLRLPPRSTNPPCPLWQMTNAIYTRILNFDRSQAREACNIDQSAIWQAVGRGWGTLDIREQMNPVIQLLREYDEKIWKTRDKVTRLAIFYKNHRLIKVGCPPRCLLQI